MRSQTESHVAEALPDGWLYEPEKLTLSISINTVPDFCLPEQGIIVEAKGVLYNQYDQLKLLAIQQSLPITIQGVVYHSYIVAACCDKREIARYEANSGCTFSMALSNSSNVISGLHLLHWCNTHGIRAVPVAQGQTSHLRQAINRIVQKRNKHNATSTRTPRRQQRS